jgi:hypothetical protein
MKLPDMVETKLRDREAILLQKPLRQEEGGMTIHYHCEGTPIGETVFPYTPEAYAGLVSFEGRLRQPGR